MHLDDQIRLPGALHRVRCGDINLRVVIGRPVEVDRSTLYRELALHGRRRQIECVRPAISREAAGEGEAILRPLRTTAARTGVQRVLLFGAADVERAAKLDVRFA